MTLLRSFLLLLCACFSMSVSSGTIVVTQSPDVSFKEGETGNITCCWSETAEKVAINWLRNQTLIKHKTFINQSTESQNEQNPYCSVLTIETARINHSGRYVCKVTVEIPILTEVEGNGTTITVRARENIPVIKDDPSLNDASQGILVIQNPVVSFQEGETGNITCCWMGTAERVGIKWLKNQTLIKHKTVINQSTGSQKEQQKYCSVLTIETAKIKDSGKYICKVSTEIPVLTEVEGNGTTVTVRARKNIAVITDDNGLNGISNVPKEDFITFVLRCLPILALITSFFWLYHLGTKAQRDIRVSAALKNEATSSQSREEDQEVDEELRECQKENDEETTEL